MEQSLKNLYYTLLNKLGEKFSLLKLLWGYGVLGRIATSIILLLFLFVVVWIVGFDSQRRIALLHHPYGLLFIGIVFAFLWAILLWKSESFPAIIRFLFLLYIIYFGLYPGIGSAPKWLMFGTIVAMFIFEARRLETNIKGLLLLAILSIGVAQFPPFLFAGKYLILQIFVKSIFLFAIGFFFAKYLKVSSIVSFIVFLAILLFFYTYCSFANIEAFEVGIQEMTNAFWGLLTTPLWIVLGGELIDQAGKGGAVVARFAKPFAQKKSIIPIMVLSIISISIVLGLAWAFGFERQFEQNYLQQLPTWLQDYFATFVKTAQTGSPLLLILGIVGFFVSKKIPQEDFTVRYLQAFLGTIIFLFLAWYGYSTLSYESIHASQFGFSFLLLGLILLWEPTKLLIGYGNKAQNYVIWISYALILWAVLLCLNLAWAPLSVAKITSLYQVLGGMVVGFPLLLVSISVGWYKDQEESSLLSNFIISYLVSLIPMVFLPNQYFFVCPIGLALSFSIIYLAMETELKGINFLMLGLGTISQVMTIWFLPLPVIYFNGFWLNSLFKNVPCELLGKEHIVLTLGLLVATVLFSVLNRTKFLPKLLCMLVSALVWTILNVLLYNL
jgi:hypothetical protein